LIKLKIKKWRMGNHHSHIKGKEGHLCIPENFMNKIYLRLFKNKIRRGHPNE